MIHNLDKLNSKGMNLIDELALCRGGKENADHLLVSCPLSIRAWEYLFPHIRNLGRYLVQSKKHWERNKRILLAKS